MLSSLGSDAPKLILLYSFSEGGIIMVVQVGRLASLALRQTEFDIWSFLLYEPKYGMQQDCS
jgi:hypothetical protein